MMSPIYLYPLLVSELPKWLEFQPPEIQNVVNTTQFKALKNQFCFLADAQGKLNIILVGCQDHYDLWSLGHCPFSLPEALYTFHPDWLKQQSPELIESLILGWELGSYRFDVFKPSERFPAKITLSDSQSLQRCQVFKETIFSIRNLINRPANDLTPETLLQHGAKLAEEYSGSAKMIFGQELLEHNYPAIYAVGKGSVHAPGLLDMRFGREDWPKVTLVGKGITFDSGGLDIKSSAHMGLMKKDMGGAAHALGLAQLILAQRLPVRLRVLIPAAENMVSDRCYRPGDVISTRKGTFVEITNTDAEGRLLLIDALSEAAAEKPDLLIDFATLTGAARTALGPDIPVYFTESDLLAEALNFYAVKEQDPLWRLPLYQPYKEYLKSSVAELVNSSNSPYAGAITAALFIQSFVNFSSWIHIDLMAWNLVDRPGRPQGGEAMAIRALYALIQSRYPLK